MKPARLAARRSLPLVFSVVACLATSVGRGAPPPANDAPIELPPFLVEDNKTVRPWVFAALPGHEFLSRCSDDLTVDFAARQQRLEELLAAVLPPQFQFHTVVPQATILAPKNLVSASARDVVMDVAPAKGAGAGDRRAGGSRSDDARVRFLPNLSLDDTDMEELFAIFDETHDDAANLIYTRNRVQFVLRRRTPALPAWFTAGFLRLFDDLEFGQDRVTLQPFQWRSAQTSYELRTNPDCPRSLLAMRDVFAAALGDDAHVAPEIAEQAALLIRWSLQDPSRREALWKLLAAADTEPVTETLVERCFNCDLTDLRDRLSDYLPTAVRDSFDVVPATLASRPALTIRTASPAEVGRLLGDWERLEIRFVAARHPEFVPVYTSLARKTLNEGRRAAPDDPALCGIMGLLECDAKDDDAARVFLETAVTANVERPRVYVELARLRYAKALEHPAGGDGRLNVPQANSILDPLSVAIGQSPPLRETYLITAQVWLRTLANIQPKNLLLLERGVALFPSEPRLLFATALLEAGYGSREKAVAYLRRGEQVGSTPELRAHFAAVRVAIEKSHGGPIDLGGGGESDKEP